MNRQIREFLKRLFSLRNIVPAFIIVAAFYGTFAQNPLGLQRDQILLALLAFLAIDSVVERIELLSGIEANLQRVKDLTERQFSGRGMLRRRSDFPRLENVISEAKQEIWITGMTLDIMATITDLFKRKAEAGMVIKLLGVTPTGDVIEEVADYCGYDKDGASERIRSNLNTLYDRLAQPLPDRIELRVTTHRLANGYFIVDPKTVDGYMTITPYFYKTPDAHMSPVLYVSRSTDAHWFAVYLEDFERLWASAKPWQPTNKKELS